MRLWPIWTHNCVAKHKPIMHKESLTQEHPSITAIRESMKILRLNGTITDALFKYICGHLEGITESGAATSASEMFQEQIIEMAKAKTSVSLMMAGQIRTFKLYECNNEPRLSVNS